MYFIAICGYSDNLNTRSDKYHDGVRTKNDRMKEIDNVGLNTKKKKKKETSSV